MISFLELFFFSSKRRHTRSKRDWSSDVCSSDLELQDYRVDDELIEMTGNEDVIFLHCLPSFHDRNTIIGEDIYRKYDLDCMEVTDKVFRGKHSKVFDQAENRMHTIKAIMVATVK